MPEIYHKPALDPKLLNPSVICSSGQVFRLRGDFGEYQACTGDKTAYFVQQRSHHNRWEFIVDNTEDWENTWVDYFDLDTNYAKYNEQIRQVGDPYVVSALNQFTGLRILKQDLWETLVSFLLSQNNNISRITNNVWNLCYKYGDYKTSPVIELIHRGCDTYWAFPTPEQLVKVDVCTLQEQIRIGYRAEYLHNLAAMVVNGQFSLEELKQMDYQDSLKYLMQVKGIGEKVANCVALYGLHHMEAYPIDVWMKRILETVYPKYTKSRYRAYLDGCYPGFQGYIQQLQFMKARKDSIQKLTK